MYVIVRSQQQHLGFASASTPKESLAIGNAAGTAVHWPSGQARPTLVCRRWPVCSVHMSGQSLQRDWVIFAYKFAVFQSYCKALPGCALDRSKVPVPDTLSLLMAKETSVGKGLHWGSSQRCLVASRLCFDCDTAQHCSSHSFAFRRVFCEGPGIPKACTRQHGEHRR